MGHYNLVDDEGKLKDSLPRRPVCTRQEGGLATYLRRKGTTKSLEVKEGLGVTLKATTKELRKLDVRLRGTVDRNGVKDRREGELHSGLELQN